MGDLSGLLNSEGMEIQDSKVTPAHLSELIKLIKDGTISGKIAKSVLPDVFETGKTPSQIVEEKGLSQISDASAIEVVIDQVITENPGPAQDYRDGKKKAIGFLVGQVMKATKGKANPQMVNQLLQQKLDG
jgi:aspartyl-tRNA(Asn)/glutamyl-tRNA(Gln) amidotransferase subunit B